MIFHVAYRLSSEAKNASALRPVRMRRAFEQIGYEVYVVAGTHAERREQTGTLKRRIRDGLAIDFVYSEAATTPTGLGEPVTWATSFTRDISFLRYCQRHRIPVGLFYRDAYWRFPIYDELVKWPLSAVLRAFYKWDLRRYRRADFRIYLPSMQMKRWLPTLRPHRVRPLPPGGDLRPTRETESDGKLRLLYVGGLGNNYRLHQAIKEISERENVLLTLCVPEAHWADRRAEYVGKMGANVTLVHQSGAELEALYAQTDVCLLAVEPIEYWGFAAPVKLFEYISYGKPILASNDTFSGEFVTERDLGWSVDYGKGKLGAKLDELSMNPREVQRVANRVQAVRAEHTWEARACEVAADLAGSDSLDQANQAFREKRI